VLPSKSEKTVLVIAQNASGAVALAKRVPGARIVAAFNTVPSEVLFGVFSARRKPGRPSLVYCGDDSGGKRVAAGIIQDIGFDPVDVVPCGFLGISNRSRCSSLRSRTKAKAARRLLTASRGSNPPRLETNLMMRASCRSRGSTWMATRAMALPRLLSGEGNDGRTEGRKSTTTPWNLAGQRGCRLGFRIVIGLSEFVLRLLQEPILTSSLSHSSFQECPLSSKFRAMQGESHDAVAERYRGVGSFRSDHLKFAEVPYDDFARPIFPFGEGFLEQKVVERMVLNMNREALHIRIFAWPLRHRPGDERRANFQSEVIVETPG